MNRIARRMNHLCAVSTYRIVPGLLSIDIFTGTSLRIPLKSAWISTVTLRAERAVRIRGLRTGRVIKSRGVAGVGRKRAPWRRRFVPRHRNRREDVVSRGSGLVPYTFPAPLPLDAKWRDLTRWIRR